MGREEIEELAVRAAEKALHRFTENDTSRCGLCADKGFGDTHEKHHEFIGGAIEFFSRLNDLKWSSIKAVFGFLCIGLVGAFLWFFFGIKTP